LTTEWRHFCASVSGKDDYGSTCLRKEGLKGGIQRLLVEVSTFDVGGLTCCLHFYLYISLKMNFKEVLGFAFFEENNSSSSSRGTLFFRVSDFIR
jgi:hypothetical protein